MYAGVFICAGVFGLMYEVMESEIQQKSVWVIDCEIRKHRRTGTQAHADTHANVHAHEDFC